MFFMQINEILKMKNQTALFYGLQVKGPAGKIFQQMSKRNFVKFSKFEEPGKFLKTKPRLMRLFLLIFLFHGGFP